jgi:hypothetical protein
VKHTIQYPTAPPRVTLDLSLKEFAVLCVLAFQRNGGDVPLRFAVDDGLNSVVADLHPEDGAKVTRALVTSSYPAESVVEAFGSSS